MAVDQRLAKFDHFVCHCTATPPSVNVDDKWIDHLHGDINKWRERAGYHVLIGRDGKVYKRDTGHLMRDYSRPGAHVGNVGPGWNTRSFGIVLAGGVDENNKPVDNFTLAQWKALEEECIAFLQAHPTPDKVRAVGHRDLLRENKGPPKACPCFDFPEWWAEQQIVAKALDDQEDVDRPPNALDQSMEYTVKAGDSLWKIARRFRTTADVLRRLNPDMANLIYPGQRIKLP